MDFEFGNVPSRAHELFHRLETQGAAYVAALVEAQKSEELFLDYKRISTPQDAKSLHDSDRMNLRKALSGFANSEGGVILWGLETGKNNGVEVPKLPDGYADAARFVSLIEDAVSGCTVPPVPGVRSIQIPLGPDGKKGLVATLIPSSLIAPHQTTDDSRAYYMRAGSSFQRVPHGVLAGMFGRRPSPMVSMGMALSECKADHEMAGFTLDLHFQLELMNSSSVLARGAYISWRANQLGTIDSSIACFSKAESRWMMSQVDLRHGSVIALEECRLAPYSRNPVLESYTSIRVYHEEDLKEDIDIEIFFGCESAAPQKQNLFFSRQQLVQAAFDLKELNGFDPQLNKARIAIGQRLLGLRSELEDI